MRLTAPYKHFKLWHRSLVPDQCQLRVWGHYVLLTLFTKQTERKVLENCNEITKECGPPSSFVDERQAESSNPRSI